MTAYYMCNHCIKPLMTNEDISRGYHKKCLEEVNRRKQEYMAHQISMIGLV